jgi:hypothetical protein
LVRTNHLRTVFNTSSLCRMALPLEPQPVSAWLAK